MLVHRAYKTEMDLNERQVTAWRQHAGAARWAYTWGLQVKQEQYRAPKRSPTASDLHRELNALKKSEVPWMYSVSKGAPQEALRNLDAAFTNCFRRCALKKQGRWKGELGYPQFKTKKNGLGSFRLTGRIVVSDKEIVLPRLGGLHRKERECLPTSDQVSSLSATLSEQAGRCYVSLQPYRSKKSRQYLRTAAQWQEAIWAVRVWRRAPTERLAPILAISNDA